MTLPTIQQKSLQPWMQLDQKYPSKEIVAIFQPHTFTRTIALLDEFAHALNQADAVYLAQIYGSAREVDHGDVKVEDLANKINKKHQVITVENVSPLPRSWQCCLRLYGCWRHPNLWIFIWTSFV